MSELRWSYDPATEELDVWDSEDGRVGHYERHGNEGYLNCAQGRIYEGRYWTIYSNRPIKGTPEEQDSVRDKGRAAVIAWAKENHQQKCLFHEVT